MRPCSLAGGLDGMDIMTAGHEVESRRNVSGGVDAGNTGFQVFVDHDTDVGLDSAAFQEPDVRRDTRGAYDKIRAERRLALEIESERAVAVPGDTVHPGRHVNVDTLLAAPCGNHVTARPVHHAGDHAVSHFDHGEIDLTGDQGLENDASDETRTHQHDIVAGFRVLHDPAGVGEGPAGHHLFQVHARNGRPDGVRSGGKKQPVESQAAAAGKGEGLCSRIDGPHGVVFHGDAETVVVAVRVAQARPFLVDVLGQEIGNCHPGVGRFRVRPTTP